MRLLTSFLARSPRKQRGSPTPGDASHKVVRPLKDLRPPARSQSLTAGPSCPEELIDTNIDCPRFFPTAPPVRTQSADGRFPS